MVVFYIEGVPMFPHGLPPTPSPLRCQITPAKHTLIYQNCLRDCDQTAQCHLPAVTASNRRGSMPLACYPHPAGLAHGVRDTGVGLAHPHVSGCRNLEVMFFCSRFPVRLRLLFPCFLFPWLFFLPPFQTQFLL